MLLRKQKGRCSICKLQFTLGDDMDTDHIIPLNLGGKDIWANVQLLHAHCHVTKTRKDSLLHIND
ncbi:HNH endonuclease [Mucilaginibacter lappiensis]|uniref:HNH endonuclease n=1 Tax=Mucilaginibacter lappiensis TaxID=354630 RepID=UPI000970D055